MASQSEREQSLGAAWTPTSFMSWWKQERTRCLSYQVVWAEEDTDARPEMSLSFTTRDAASVSQSLRRHKATAPWQQGFLALRENGGVQLSGSGRFLVCRSSADDHISSVVTNAIRRGCQRRIQAQRGELLSFRPFVSLQELQGPKEINLGASCVGNLTAPRSSSWLVVWWIVCLIRNRHRPCSESWDDAAAAQQGQLSRVYYVSSSSAVINSVSTSLWFLCDEICRFQTGRHS